MKTYSLLIILGGLYWNNLVAQKTPQQRNDEVRYLNTIIGWMDEYSRLNMNTYHDLLQFSGDYQRALKSGTNYAFSTLSVKPNRKHKSATVSQLPNAKPDKNGFVDDFQTRLMPLWKQTTLLKQFQNPVEDAQIKKQITAYETIADALLARYQQLISYVNEQRYIEDAGFTNASTIISELSILLAGQQAVSSQLYQSVYNYYTQQLPPLKLQQTVLSARNEPLKVVDLLTHWEADLLNGSSNNRANDSILRVFQHQALAKSDAYFQKSYGYKNFSNGAFPHSRYNNFYRQMESGIFWFAAASRSAPKQIDNQTYNYNQFIFHYNNVIELYNKFIECADGAALARNMDYSMAMAGQIGVDTAQNVLLKIPRKTFLFGWPKHIEHTIAYQIDDEKTSDTLSLLATAAPHHTVYLLDISNSMKEEHKLDTLTKGIKNLIQIQRAVDRISVITFSDTAKTIMKWVPCNEKDSIAALVDSLKTFGGTNIDDALLDGYALADSTLKDPGVTKIMIVTDGQFELSKKIKKTIEAYQKQGVYLNILLLGSVHDINTIKYFEMLCSKGNGTFYDMRKHRLQDVLLKEAIH